MQPMLNIAVKAARAAGATISRHIDRIDRLTIQSKSQNDFVSEVDHLAEQDIIRILRRAYPSHGILAEESGSVDGDEFLWIIDPLDGTTNFLHGFPHFCVSIALQYKGTLEHAVIYDPGRQELFCASRGDGAQLNNHRIRVTPRPSLEGALLGTGIPFRQQQDLAAYLDTLKTVIPGTAGIRRAGSAALDLAYVAAGRLDGYWEYGLKPWDMAAGMLLVQEAGGMVNEPNGGDEPLKKGNIVAANPKIAQEMTQKIKSTQA